MSINFSKKKKNYMSIYLHHSTIYSFGGKVIGCWPRTSRVQTPPKLSTYVQLQTQLGGAAASCKPTPAIQKFLLPFWHPRRHLIYGAVPRTIAVKICFVMMTSCYTFSLQFSLISIQYLAPCSSSSNVQHSCASKSDILIHPRMSFHHEGI